MMRFLSAILVLPGKSLQLKRLNFEVKPNTFIKSVLEYHFCDIKSQDSKKVLVLCFTELHLRSLSALLCLQDSIYMHLFLCF